MPGPALEVVGACKHFFEPDDDNPRPLWRFWSTAPRRRVDAVKDISFSVNPGEIYGILGPNGSGKSTLIRLIATLLIPDAGAVSVFGMDVQRYLSQVRQLMNRVSVDAAFFKKLSAMENLSYAARLYGMEMAEGDDQPQSGPAG